MLPKFSLQRSCIWKQPPGRFSPGTIFPLKYFTNLEFDHKLLKNSYFAQSKCKVKIKDKTGVKVKIKVIVLINEYMKAKVKNHLRYTMSVVTIIPVLDEFKNDSIKQVKDKK